MGQNIGLEDNKCCLKLQFAADQMFGDLNPATHTEDHGFLASLVSSRNTDGFAVLPTAQSEGKERPAADTGREIRVEYYTKRCSSNGYDEPRGLCSDEDPDTIDPLKYANYTVDEFHGFDVRLDAEQYRAFCENPLEAYDRWFRSTIDAEIGAINQKLLAKAAGQFGTYPQPPNDNSVNDPKTLNIITSDGMANPLFWSLLMMHYKKMNISTRPIVVGEGKLDIYADAVGFSAFNDGGLDGSKSANIEYFRDQDLKNVNPFDDGNDWILTYQPGTFIFAEWFENIGYYDSMQNPAIVHPPNEKTRITAQGFTWDFYMKIDECDGSRIFRFEKWFDVVSRVPSDGFNTACQPWNYALAFLLGCGDVSCQEIEDATNGTPVVT